MRLAQPLTAAHDAELVAAHRARAEHIDQIEQHRAFSPFAPAKPAPSGISRFPRRAGCAWLRACPQLILITGGARRIGGALTRAFAAAGWHVVIHCGGSRAAAEELAASLPSAEVVSCDLGDGEAALAMIADLAGRLDDWRMLVNCAAVFKPDTAQAIDHAVFAEAMTVNAETPTRMAQAFLASARARGGRRVIQFLDQKLLNPNPDFFSYTMAKHAFAANIRMMAMAQSAPGRPRLWAGPGCDAAKLRPEARGARSQRPDGFRSTA